MLSTRLPFGLSLTGLAEIWRRFPVSAASAVLAFLLFNILPYIKGHTGYAIAEILPRLGWAFSAFTLVACLGEVAGWRRPRVLLTAATVYLVYLLGGDLTWATLAGALALFALAAWRCDHDEETAYARQMTVAGAIRASVLIGFILSAGIFILTYTLGLLFGGGMAVAAVFMRWLYPVLFALVLPFYFLSHLPRFSEGDDAALARWHRHPTVCTILTYALVPLVLAYGAILHAYAAKIVLLGELPRGGVVWMVAFYALVGMLTWALALQWKDANRLLRYFYTHFFSLMLVPAILIVTAIGIRLAQYGLTEQRYIVALFAIFVVVVSAYSFLRPKAELMLVAPLVAAILMFYAGLPGVGMHDSLARTGFHSFERVLAQNGMLADGHIKPAPQGISLEDRSRITGAVDNMLQQPMFARRMLPRYFDPLVAAKIFPPAERGVERQALYDALGIRPVMSQAGGHREIEMSEPRTVVMEVDPDKAYDVDLRGYARMRLLPVYGIHAMVRARDVPVTMHIDVTAQTITLQQRMESGEKLFSYAMAAKDIRQLPDLQTKTYVGWKPDRPLVLLSQDGTAKLVATRATFRMAFENAPPELVDLRGYLLLK